MSAKTGNLADMPLLPMTEWPETGHRIWREAEALVAAGYHFKCRDACSILRVPFEPGWMERGTALTAGELGAPTAQALWVATMRARKETT